VMLVWSLNSFNFSDFRSGSRRPPRSSSRSVLVSAFYLHWLVIMTFVMTVTGRRLVVSINLHIFTVMQSSQVSLIRARASCPALSYFLCLAIWACCWTRRLMRLLEVLVGVNKFA
jgi:hypothetical protein